MLSWRAHNIFKLTVNALSVLLFAIGKSHEAKLAFVLSNIYEFIVDPAMLIKTSRNSMIVESFVHHVCVLCWSIAIFYDSFTTCMTHSVFLVCASRAFIYIGAIVKRSRPIAKMCIGLEFIVLLIDPILFINKCGNKYICYCQSLFTVLFVAYQITIKIKHLADIGVILVFKPPEGSDEPIMKTLHVPSWGMSRRS